MTKILKKLRRSEFEEQQAVFEWAAHMEIHYPALKLLHGSSMGGTRIPFEILNKFKKIGMKKGKPDINLPVPAGDYVGLWIELKRRDRSKVTKEQRWWLHTLAKYGHACYVCRGSDAAIKVISEYLGITTYERKS